MTTGRGVPAGRLGDLERAVMDVLWARGEPVTVRTVHDDLADRNLAYTTVMTVLARLAEKDVVRRTRYGRAWWYAPKVGKAEYVAELMLNALALTGDSAPALVRFAKSVSLAEAEALRQALAARV